MITLSFTEEDRTLLLNLSSIQRDRVFFALLAGGRQQRIGGKWNEIPWHQSERRLRPGKRLRTG